MYVLYLYGLDIYAPLDQQYYNSASNITFADYYTELAVEKAVTDYAIYDLAVSKGMKLSEDDIASIDSTIKSLGHHFSGSETTSCQGSWGLAGLKG